jgi:hypothetical protein
MDKSAPAVTAVTTEAALLPGTVSVAALVALAVLVIVPAVVGETVIVADALEELEMVPKEQVIIPLDWA